MKYVQLPFFAPCLFVVVGHCGSIGGIDWLPVCAVRCWRIPELSFFPTSSLSPSLSLSLSLSLCLAPAVVDRCQHEHVSRRPHDERCLDLPAWAEVSHRLLEPLLPFLSVLEILVIGTQSVVT